MEEVRFELFLKDGQDLAKGILICKGEEVEVSKAQPSIRKKIPVGETWEIRLDETRKGFNAA